MKSLIQIFETNIQKEDKKPSKAKFRIRPSYIGSKCYRKILYQATNTPPDYPFPLSGRKRTKMGDAVHHMIKEAFDDIIVKYRNEDGSTIVNEKGEPDYEFPVSAPDLFIDNGHIDALTIIDGELWLGEFKSINMRGFNALYGPKEDHAIQIMIYLYLFNEQLAAGRYAHIEELKGFEKAKGVRILYINKDDTDMREYVISESSQAFASIVEKIMTIRNYYDVKALPPKTIEFCQSCQYRDKCKKNVNFVVSQESDE